MCRQDVITRPSVMPKGFTAAPERQRAVAESQLELPEEVGRGWKEVVRGGSLRRPAAVVFIYLPILVHCYRTAY
ncbi:hypothetical protein JTE90_003032 [Oedothorax gibbosus]|uniref:Uncharacterized protein n=1 Tax=Oedothorax gibbosus TaxID=931172 RepID=A0AAV6VBV7_9ARAC|nr:hypothetical protein JTE90_003032 [Oedothorax gibbosus]